VNLSQITWRKTRRIEPVESTRPAASVHQL